MIICKKRRSFTAFIRFRKEVINCIVTLIDYKTMNCLANKFEFLKIKPCSHSSKVFIFCTQFPMGKVKLSKIVILNEKQYCINSLRER